jgi:hypothetical protein
MCTAKMLLSLGAPDCPVVHRTVRWCTGQCPVVHRTVSGASGWRLSTSCSRDFGGGVRLKFTGLSGEPSVDRANGRPRNPRATRGRANDQKGAQDCPVCTGQCPMHQRL